MIYLDHNATTAIDHQVLAAMSPYLSGIYGNASSLHKLGRIARSALETAREQVAALADCLPEQVIFTSGGTEANALALHQVTGRLFISAIEHPSITENALNAIRLPVDADGILHRQTLQQAEIRVGDFVSVMLANNETGVLQNISEIADYVRQQNAILHTDAVQAYGKIPLSFRQLGVQLMSLSSHKIYGPKGCGALIRDINLPFRSRQCGGEQEQGFRAGTENVAAIVGFGKAAEMAKLALDERIAHLQNLRDYLQQQLKSIPGMVIFAEHAPRLPNTVQFAVPGHRGDMLLMQLDRLDIAVSSGSACAAGKTQISPVLAAMSVEPRLAHAAIRIGLGKDNTLAHIDEFMRVLKSLLSIV